MSEYTEVVTVGDGKDFATVEAAYDAVAVGGAIIIDPGLYLFNPPLEINKKVDVIGAQPNGQVILRAAPFTSQAVYFGNNAQCLIENIEFRTTSSVLSTGTVNLERRCVYWDRVSGCELTFNRCRFSSDYAVYSLIRSGARFEDGDHPIMRFTQCEFINPRSNGVFGRVQANLIRVQRSQRNNTAMDFQTRGSWLEDDTVTEATAGYGDEYGWTLAKAPINALINSRVIDIVTSNPRVTVFDWHNPQLHTTPQPNPDGYWQAYVPRGVEFGIYYLSQDPRNPPIVHGPYIET